MSTLTLLHTSDLHGKLDDKKLPFLLSLRPEADLYFDTGDVVKSGNLSVPFWRDSSWASLAEAKCDASVPGNRETHIFVGGVKAKFSGAAHPVVCANWFDRKGAQVFPGQLTFEVKGLRVSVLGVMVPMVTKGMKTQAASSYLWEKPIPAAVELASSLRKDADVVIALTHIGLANDRILAETTSDIDIILGGHSHTVIEQPETVNGTPICHVGAHGHYVGRYTIEVGKGLKSAELLPWH